MSDIINDSITSNSVYINDKKIYSKKINSVPTPPIEIGLDTENKFYENVLDAAKASKLDMSKFESFLQVSQDRNTIYDLLDTMAEDPINAAVLETYAEDATETNDSGKIMWVESDDAEVAKFVDFLLQSLNVDKYLYKWAYSLCKYGDLYLRLYRKSEFNDALFDNNDKNLSDKKENSKSNKNLNEDVNFNAFSSTDNYEHYIEMYPNPAEIFELTKFGKSYAYIKAPVNTTSRVNNLSNIYYKYQFKKRDIDVYNATTFVHATLDNGMNRTEETVDIFLDSDDSNSTPLSYTVKRGQSVFYNLYKIWRELNLLENSLLLNRLTKSSIVRILNVEVGDMPKEQVGPHLLGIKNLIEQKTAINTGTSLNEYNNPGPIENNIYVPVHNGQGAITTQEISGDLNVTGLADIDYFKNKYFGSLRIPKQYFGETDDATGFNGGTSLSITSSRYAKMIKRIQNTLIQAITDVINILLIDKNLNSYINKYQLHMQPPTTQEELDRRDNMSTKVGIATDIMNLLDSIEDSDAKLKILKSLLSNIVDDNEIINIIQEQIEKIEKSNDNNQIDGLENQDDSDINIKNNISIPDRLSNRLQQTDNSSETDSSSETDNSSELDKQSDSADNTDNDEQILPTPAQLNAGDFSSMADLDSDSV